MPCPVRLALFARANLTQIAKGIDPGRVAVVPVKLDRIMADLGGTSYLNRTLAEDWEWVGLCFDFRRFVSTRGARTILAEIAVGIRGLVTIIPVDGNSTRS
jgi:hypothetical protein